MAENLILYYSRKGQNYSGGTIVFLEKGNSETAAEYIKAAVGGELFEIETVEKYPDDYNECIELAHSELKKKARPAIVKFPENIDRYDNIFICGPCWWGTYPMAVFTLIDRLRLDGKNIIPLMTHEGSGLGSCERDLKKACKKAKIKKGLAIQGSEVTNSEQVIAGWAKNSI